MHRVARWPKIVGWYLRYRLMRDQKAHWEYQYALGRWEKLKSDSEAERLQNTARLLLTHAPAGRVLEIGCGEALLQGRVPAGQYQEWIGIDLSTVAIQRAQTAGLPQAHYLVADMETFIPNGQFDAIVFTESIYYSQDCARLLQRYAHYLTPHGHFFVSIFRTKRSAKIQESIHSVTQVINATSTTNDVGTWDCEVLRPSS